MERDEGTDVVDKRKETNMEKNRVKISCNPYKKKIEYKRWDLNEELGDYQWENLGPKSKLLTDEKYTKTTIQNYAYEIVTEVEKEYNRGESGLEIVFEGTEEDYNDLEEIVDSAFASKKVTCKRGDLCIEPAIVVKKQIEEVFSNLEKDFDTYTLEETEIKQAIKKYKDATKMEIPICVIGTYSTGKSAFINSLIGKEILTSDCEATTARNYRIVQSEKNGSIKFSIGKEKIVIKYEDDKYEIEGKMDTELRRELETIKGASLTENMYHTLYKINEYANETDNCADETDKIADLIEVEVPFSKGELVNDKYQFVIYDTPGSNTESHKEHLTVLKKALAKQTNGLPVILTAPDKMDEMGVDGLLELVDEIDGSLDKTNTMIVVNKADTLDERGLEKLKKDENTSLSRRKKKGRYYMSAIIGLGSKKDDYLNKKDEWNNSNYSKIYRNYYEDFIDSKSKDYMQLYLYNQIPTNRMESYCSRIRDEKENDQKLLYINSGLHCVEQEILDFAEKYAPYNKCAQAREYLREAIDMTSQKLSDTEKSKQAFVKKIEEELDTEKRKLIKKLRDRIDELTQTYSNNYPGYMTAKVDKLVPEKEKAISLAVISEWELVKDKKDKKRVDKFLSGMNDHFRYIEGDCKKDLLKDSKEYWDKKTKKVREECCEIIDVDKNLSREEQEIFRKFIMEEHISWKEDKEINISKDDISVHLIKIFGLKFIKRDKIDKTRTKKEYCKILEDYIQKVNTHINDDHKKGFKDWSKKLEEGLAAQAVSLNRDLNELSDTLKLYRQDIENYQEQLDKIKKIQAEIDQISNFKRREEA